MRGIRRQEKRDKKLSKLRRANNRKSLEIIIQARERRMEKILGKESS